ncbi:MAG: zinc/manganese transport system ATP-binding protein [Chloroflexota bacterium]|jgi:zinc/manganese transport system ATP-binding protein|nr:zinc/manganese transport system ATP-binding protein [Chloroflexota bacterium]
MTMANGARVVASTDATVSGRGGVPSRSPLVRFSGVSCGYDRGAVLRGIDLTIDAGAFVGIVGPSGAGKTTLLRAIVGAVPRIEGSLTFDGRPVRRGGTPGVGWVPQLETVDWNFPATVGEVVLMGRWSDRPWQAWASREDRAAVDRLLDRLGIGGLRGRHIRELSGGQQQRVFLARALIGDPRLLLLDEPTSGVDLKTRDDILHLLADLNGDGVTILITTHELNTVAAHLPWVVCVNGSIVAEGDPDVIFTSEILGRTYGADLRVVRQDGIVLVADAAPHRLRNALRHAHEGFEHAHHEHADAGHVHRAGDHVHDAGDHGHDAGDHGHEDRPAR